MGFELLGLAGMLFQLIPCATPCDEAKARMNIGATAYDVEGARIAFSIVRINWRLMELKITKYDVLSSVVNYRIL